MLDKRSHYIDGHWVSPSDGSKEFEVINPATEKPVAVISLGTANDADSAVRAATRAFRSWSETSLAERAALLQRVIDVYRRRQDEMTRAITLEMGAPVSFSNDSQMPAGEGHLVATLEALQTYAFEQPSPRGGSTIREEPIGVCALITPWNWPINQIVVKVAPAIAVGCTCILKPSELAPLSAMLFAEMLDEAGCPPGVFNLVNGDGPTVGAALSRHPLVDMVSFTGSTSAGIAVSKASAETVKRVSLELGGKSPNLLFADADVPKAAYWSASRSFRNSGQSCNAPSRLLVETSVYDEVVAIAAKVASETVTGDPELEGGHIGPVISQSHYDKVQSLIQKGLDEGARLVAGGTGRPERNGAGYYVRPTVFADVSSEMAIAREEIFGPVLVIIPFIDEQHAIDLANDTPYGLAAFIQTSDHDRAARVARKLRSGTVSVNGGVADYDAPFGGYKQSGNGRENGLHGLKDFLEVKAMTFG